MIKQTLRLLDTLLVARQVAKLKDEAGPSHTGHKGTEKLQLQTSKSPPISPKEVLRQPEKAMDKTKELFEWSDVVRESLNTKFGDEDQGAHKTGATTAKSPKELAKLDVDHVTKGTND